MTAAYGLLNSNAPDGTTGTPTTYSASDLSNVRALRDAAICGFVPNWAYSQNGGSNIAPTNRVWAQVGGAIQFRLVALAYDGTYTYMPTSVKWQWSDDTGSTWADMDATATTITWATASSQLVITAANRNSGLWVFALQGMVNALRAAEALNTHAAATGTGVHGLGTMSTQNANGVAVTGGTINSTSVGATTPSTVDALRARETMTGVTAVANAGTYTANVAAAAYHKIQPSATTSHTMTIAAPSNPPSGTITQTIVIEIVNGRRDIDGRITWDAAWRWTGGASARPADTSLELAGSNLFYATWNGTNWDISHAGKRG